MNLVQHGQELVAVAKVVLSELARGVAERFEQFRDGRVFLPQTERCPGQADLVECGAQAVLASDE